MPRQAELFFALVTRRRMVLNIVMVGFFAAVTKLLDPQAVRKAVEESVPRGTLDLNLRAFDKGYQYGLSLGSN